LRGHDDISDELCRMPAAVLRERMMRRDVSPVEMTQAARCASPPTRHVTSAQAS
jgi:hypothetical protein